MPEGHRPPTPGAPREPPRQAQAPDYIRFAGLGDSATCGVGDPTPDGWRGWAQILAEAIADDHHVSFCKLAIPGAVVADVRGKQLDDAIAHRPVLASLVVGLNDVLRRPGIPVQIRTDLLHCAGALARHGALVLTVRFHDHTRVLGLPDFLARRHDFGSRSSRDLRRGPPAVTAACGSISQPTLPFTPPRCGSSTGSTPPSSGIADSHVRSPSC